MIIVRAPKRFELPVDLPKVFLAGCANTDWRKDFIKHFEDDAQVIFLDPKRDDWNLMDASKTLEQITWEFKNLRDADIIIYHFNGGSVCPITLLEYGMWGLSTGRSMLVYVNSDYEKGRDVVIQTALARPDITIITNKDDLIAKTKEMLETYNVHD